MPLFTIVALWFGGLVIALARGRCPAHAAHRLAVAIDRGGRCGGRRRSGQDRGSSSAVALLFGVSIGPAQWLGFTGASLIIGAVFALVNQGLAAAFGAVGRLIAVLIGLVALTAGLTSTVPPVIESIAGALPTRPPTTCCSPRSPATPPRRHSPWSCWCSPRSWALRSCSRASRLGAAFGPVRWLDAADAV